MNTRGLFSSATDIRLKDSACGMYWEETKHD